MIQIKKSSVLLALPLITASSIAAANSGTRYPANNCVVYTGTPTYANGTLVNNANVPLGVECPVPVAWKTPDASAIVGLKFVTARVVDNNANANIKCELFTADAHSTTPNVLENLSFQTRMSAGNNGRPQNLNFSNAPTDDSTFGILRCVLPPKSGATGSALISYTSEIDLTLS